MGVPGAQGPLSPDLHGPAQRYLLGGQSSSPPSSRLSGAVLKEVTAGWCWGLWAASELGQGLGTGGGHHRRQSSAWRSRPCVCRAAVWAQQNLRALCWAEKRLDLIWTQWGQASPSFPECWFVKALGAAWPPPRPTPH